MRGSSFENRHFVTKELLKLNNNKQAENYFILFLVIKYV